MSDPSHQPPPPVNQPTPPPSHNPPPPGYGAPPPQPPKKRHTGRNVGLGCGGTILALIVLIVIIAVASSSGGGNKPQSNSGQSHATSSATPASKPTTAPKPTSKPVTKPTSPSAPNSVTLRVWGNDGGNGTQISENTDTSNASVSANIDGGSASSPAWSATLPFNSKQEYYAVTAQMQGTGAIYCSVAIVDNGKTYTKQGSGSGQYEICSAQLNNGILGGWD